MKFNLRAEANLISVSYIILLASATCSCSRKTVQSSDRLTTATATAMTIKADSTSRKNTDSVAAKSLFRDRLKATTDTVRERVEHFVYVKGDTVREFKTVYRDRWHNSTDTVVIYKSDSTATSAASESRVERSDSTAQSAYMNASSNVKEEKQMPWWQKALLWLAVIMVGWGVLKGTFKNK